MLKSSSFVQFLIAGSFFAATLHSQPVQAIQNGKSVTLAEILEKGLVDVGGNCSGVLISNDWVMTAGHCTIANRLSPQNIAVTFNSVSIRADALYLFGGYVDEVGPDLSLLHLS